VRPEVSGVHVTPSERKRLLGISRDTHEPPRARLRSSIILMTAEGMSASQITRVTGSCERTVREARSRWRRRAFEGLYDRPHTGRPPRVNSRYLRLMSQVVQTDPRKLGYAFAHWTAPRLTEYLKHRTGIGLCDDWLRRRLNRLGFVWRRTKLTIRNLQNPRGKKEGSGAAVAAADSGPTTPGEVRTLVWRRG
jgi:transposase